MIIAFLSIPKRSNQPFFLFGILLLIFGCQTTPKEQPPVTATNLMDTIVTTTITVDTLISAITKTEKTINPIDYDTTLWTELIRLDDGFILNLKYATEDNFVDRQLYDCPRCFLHPDAAQALLKVQQELAKLDYTLMLFDCYRPWSVQQALWDIMPNASYVTPPKKGSMHNRGLAVDLTIAHLNGDTLEMGTPFDYFGARGHHTYTHHTPTVQANRALLKSTMAKHGFSSIRTEWWHYSYRGVHRKTANMQWACD